MRIPKPHLIIGKFSPKLKLYQLDIATQNLLEKNYDLEISDCKVASLQDLVHDSSTLIITSKGTKYVLKIYIDNIQEDALIYETAILQHLSNHQLAVVQPLRSNHGDAYLADKNIFYTVSPYINGYMYRDYYLTMKERQNYVSLAAQFLGKMHAATENVLLPGNREWPYFNGNLSTFEKKMTSIKDVNTNSNGKLLSKLDEMLNLWHNLLENKTVYQKLPRCIVHEDYGPYNLIFNKGKITGVIDFMDAHPDCRIKDVIYSLMMFSNTRKGQFNPALVKNFMKSYQAEVTLDEIEFEVMSDLFCLKRLNEMPEFIDAYLKDNDNGVDYLDMIWKFIEEIEWHQNYKNELIRLVKEVH